MGFAFSETMSGTFAWDREPDKQLPLRFEVTAHAASMRQHLSTGQAALRGTIHAPGLADGTPAEGSIVIRPIGQRIIRYELRFRGDDGKHYELVGQKDIRWLAPLETFTSLPAEILDDQHHRIATCMLRFDLRRDGFRFLRSFRPA
jgi:hypothetical protein